MLNGVLMVPIGDVSGHSPGVGQFNAVITLKGLGYRRRQRGAANQCNV
ncbi:hypothetical protein LNP25_19330 [Klebsiella variicola subsp. variicola]|nr:hypothetical protein [Klebsiella variicola subsp. variicola]